MAKLFDYAALSGEQGGISPVTNSTPPRRPEASDTALDFGPQSAISVSDDSAVIETGHIRPDPLSVPEEVDWPNGFFDVFSDVTNDWSFLGQRWSTHFFEGPR